MTIELEVHPATPARWADVVAVIGGCAVANRCWCAYWYLSNADYKAGWGEQNRLPLENRVAAGDAPGIVGYVDGEPVAWVGVAPRTAFDRLNRSKNFAPVDDLPVWAVNCFVVAKRFRRRGLMPRLAKAAADFALAKGAPGVEAYPIEPSEKSGAGDLYVGTVNAFRKAGYVEVARPLPRRPIMRLMAQ
jgi:GNAT superfamily N-acetyltransferase